MLGGRGREALRFGLRVFVFPPEHKVGYERTEVANLHFSRDPRVEKYRAATVSRRRGEGSEGVNRYNLGVTKTGAHTGIEAGVCPNPRTSVHPSGRETDVPVRDPVSTEDSTHRSHASHGEIL